MSAIGACSSTPGDPTGQPICPIGTFPSNPPINNGMSGSGIDGMNIATDSGPLNIHKGPGGPIGLVVNREMRASHLIHQKVAANATGKVTLYERTVDNGPAKTVTADHLYLVISTNSGQSITIEAGPSDPSEAFGSGVGSAVVLQNYTGDNGTNTGEGIVNVSVPSGEAFAQFANQLITGANYFDMNNSDIYGGATSNSNSFMSGLLNWAGASSALTTMNSYNQGPIGPLVSLPGANQPFNSLQYGPNG